MLCSLEVSHLLRHCNPKLSLAKADSMVKASVLLSRPFRSRDQDRDLRHQVSRSRPRPLPSGLKTKTEILAIRSRDRDKDLGHQVSRPRPRPGQNELESRDHVSRSQHWKALSSMWNSDRCDSRFAVLWDTVVREADSLGVEPPVMPRVRRLPRRLDDGSLQHKEQQVEDVYRRLYFSSLDAAIT